MNYLRCTLISLCVMEGNGHYLVNMVFYPPSYIVTSDETEGDSLPDNYMELRPTREVDMNFF